MSVKNASKRKSFNVKFSNKKPKRFSRLEDDEISSDSEEEKEENENLKEDSESDLEETAQEKKIRLTKQYLEELKELQSQEDNEAADAVGDKLQEDILEKAGRLQKQVADKCIVPKVSDMEVLRGHKLSVTCIAVSSDGKFLFSTSKDCSIIKWDAVEFKKIKKVSGGHRSDPKITHTAHILCLAISTDGEFLVSGSMDKMIHVWKAETMEHLHRFQGHRGAVSGVAFRLNSHQLFSSSFDRCVKVWDLDAMGYVETLFGHQDLVQACDSLSRERCATAGGRDGSIRIWKIAEESQLVYHGHNGSIDCLKLINEEYFISGADDGSICLWSVMKKKPTTCVKNAHPDSSSKSPWITAVTALINSDLVATGSSNGAVKIWKCGPKFLTIEHLFDIPVVGFVNSLQFSPTGNKLFIGVGQEHRLGRWWRLKEARNSIIIVSLFEEKA
uniref:U3 small nucleolar RNA-interacting protein 2-like n=1 Tax=Styela clava TaxID=7725 RepID=UPI001939BDB9|nr:U3 small nucleolar RNA-interacting protein 2-like [Styela clava]